MPVVLIRTAALVGVAGLAFWIAGCASRTVPGPDPAMAPTGGSRVAFNQVRAILRDSCEHCHNEEKAKAGFALDSFDRLVTGGESGSPIVPRSSAESLLVQVIEGHVKPRMPYKEDPLAAEDIALIRRWIDQGAPGPLPGEAPVQVEIPEIRLHRPVPGPVAAVAFDAATGRIAAGSYRRVHLMSFGERLWTASLDGHADLVRALAFSTDGRRLAVAGGRSGGLGEVRIWDVSGKQPTLTATISGHKDAILTVAFSPDGSMLATGSYDKLVKLWDAATGAEIRTLKEHSDAVYAVAFIPGRSELVSAAGDRTLKVWDVTSGRRLFTISDALDAVYALAVHPTGSKIAAGGADRMIRTWAWHGDPSTNGGPGATLLTSAFAHGDAVLGLGYSADGSLLASSSADRTLKIWDAVALREKRLFPAQPDWVLGLALSRDGRWLAAGRYDGTLAVYSLDDSGPGEQFALPTANPRRSRGGQ
jgi:Planctomycete cytochrome C/WD domain, G-beta repeat